MFIDPVLQKLVEKYSPPHFEDKSEFLFQSLIESIISQQLSTKIADIITIRFIKLFGDKTFPTAEEVIEMPEDTIRTAGLSYAKIAYCKAIAQAFVDDSIAISKLKMMSDEEIITELTKIKGVGQWTAEMILIFTLKRPDIFSIGDAGIRRAIQNLYGISDKKEILRLSETWKPNRSTACWYLWRSLENKQM